MVVICEECGKVYKLDSEKLKKSMKGKTSKIKCRVCDHVITITLNEDDSLDAMSENSQHVAFQPSFENDESSNDFQSPDNDDGLADDEYQEGYTSEPGETQTIETPIQSQVKKAKPKKTSGIGLRAKMFFLFLVIPLGLMIGSGYFSNTQMINLANDITEKSTSVVKELAEQSIINKAQSVASQCSIFLQNNPDLNKEDFYYDLDLQQISIQKVGNNGYTALLERPDPEENDDHFVIWCHPDQKMIGKPLLPTFKSALGSSYGTYRTVINSLRKGKGDSGYYTWTDEKGHTRDMFIAAEPIEQSKYMVISTTYIEDFTTPIKNLEIAAKKSTDETRNINIVIFAAFLIIISLSISIYGHRLSTNIGKLTDAADRISVGELDVVVDVKSKDEIGALAEAISRMQDSLRFSIERLRRRK